MSLLLNYQIQNDINSINGGDLTSLQNTLRRKFSFNSTKTLNNEEKIIKIIEKVIKKYINALKLEIKKTETESESESGSNILSLFNFTGMLSDSKSKSKSKKNQESNSEFDSKFESSDSNPTQIVKYINIILINIIKLLKQNNLEPFNNDVLKRIFEKISGLLTNNKNILYVSNLYKVNNTDDYEKLLNVFKRCE
jgi:hypothetical protein